MPMDGKLPKLLLTSFQNRRFAIGYGNRPEFIEYVEEDAFLGSVHLGRVKNINKNIQAAFVEVLHNGEREMVYFSLDNPLPLFGDDRAHDRVKEGDEILLQITKAPLKTKLAVASSVLKLPQAERERLLKEKAYRQAPAPLYAPKTDFLSLICQIAPGGVREMVTEDPELYRRILSKKDALGELPFSLRLYQDEFLPLYKLYSLETLFAEALQKRVWLKSGGYLVIEATEAFTVVDVNTGKNLAKKDRETLFFETNKEAVQETARQMRLRNLSGIILVDLIDMKEPDHRQAVLALAREALSKDRVQAVALDITRLGILEITRRKEKPSLQEILRKP